MENDDNFESGRSYPGKSFTHWIQVLDEAFFGRQRIIVPYARSITQESIVEKPVDDKEL